MKKNYRKICAILYNWKKVDPIEVGFSLNKRAKRAEISLTDNTHEAINVSEIFDLNLPQFGLCEKCFSCIFSMNKAVNVLNNIEKNYSKILIS